MFSIVISRINLFKFEYVLCKICICIYNALLLGKVQPASSVRATAFAGASTGRPHPKKPLLIKINRLSEIQPTQYHYYQKDVLFLFILNIKMICFLKLHNNILIFNSVFVENQYGLFSSISNLETLGPEVGYIFFLIHFTNYFL